MKLKSTYYICEVKCLTQIYRNCASEFDCGHGPLRLGYTIMPTCNRRLWELCLRGAQQIYVLIDWLTTTDCSMEKVKKTTTSTQWNDNKTKRVQQQDELFQAIVFSHHTE